jgi:hypothetical protein
MCLKVDFVGVPRVGGDDLLSFSMQPKVCLEVRVFNFFRL